MATKIDVYSMSIASAGTGSQEVYVDSYFQCSLRIEDNSAWNAGTGNAVVQVWGSYSSGTTHMPIIAAGLLGNASISTSGDGVYNLPAVQGVPYLSVHVSTATTSTGIFHLMLTRT